MIFQYYLGFVQIGPSFDMGDTKDAASLRSILGVIQREDLVLLIRVAWLSCGITSPYAHVEVE